MKEEYELTKEAYSVKEVAQVLGINENAAYNLAQKEDFPTIKIGKRILVPKEPFRDWLTEKSLAKEEIEGVI